MTPKRFPGVERIRCRPRVPFMVFDHFGEVGWGSNGGFQAVNLAFQLGAKTVLGVGFDMSLQHGVHWHGRHPAGLNNPKQASVDKWRTQMDAQAPLLERLGLEFLIASPNSTLTAFRRVDLLEALGL